MINRGQESQVPPNQVMNYAPAAPPTEGRTPSTLNNGMELTQSVMYSRKSNEQHSR